MVFTAEKRPKKPAKWLETSLFEGKKRPKLSAPFLKADLEPIFGERNKRSEGTEEAVESSSLHLLGEFKPKRYSSKAKPKSRKAE